MITVACLEYSYGDHRVLDGIDFEAESGEIVCVLGRNGAGKSTLFRCLLHLLTNYQGNISIDGKNIKEVPRKELSRMIAYIPQSSTPVFDYSVFDVVSMGRTSQGGSAGKSSDDDIVFQTLDDLGIGHIATKGFAHISGGERQMALIARALVQQAGILIMDEPTANLDFGNQHLVLEQAKRLKEAGYLVIMSTHNPQHALSYATRVLMLSNGRLIRKGPPDDVLDEGLLARVYGVDVEILDVERKDGSGTSRICLAL